MTVLDDFLSRRRAEMAAAHVPYGAGVLDIGSDDGSFLARLEDRISHGVGVDEVYRSPRREDKRQLLPGSFPHNLPDFMEPFQVITMLAVLEHLPAKDLPSAAQKCAELLVPGGRVIITIPSPLVDHLLAILSGLRLVSGKKLEQHYGLSPRRAIAPFLADSFTLLTWKKFQLGLNNLVVLQKT